MFFLTVGERLVRFIHCNLDNQHFSLQQFPSENVYTRPWSDDPSFLGLHWDDYMDANGYMRSSLACEYDQVEAMGSGLFY